MNVVLEFYLLFGNEAYFIIDLCTYKIDVSLILGDNGIYLAMSQLFRSNFLHFRLAAFDARMLSS